MPITCSSCGVEKAALRRPKTGDKVTTSCATRCCAFCNFCQSCLVFLDLTCFLLRAQLCKVCFFAAFEQEVHEAILTNKLFTAGDRVAVGASGEVRKSCTSCSRLVVDVKELDAL